MEHMRDSSWRTATSATLHCLTGCAIGEVLGMIIATAAGWSTVPSIAISVALAFLFGYALTGLSLLRAGLARATVIALAQAADTLSIATREVVDKLCQVVVAGAIDAALSDALFWWSLAVALAVAFVVTVPVNRALIRRGKGHAVVHEHHHAHH
jgi:hypothetical protein